MKDIKQRAHKMFDDRFAPNGFISEDEELVVPKIKSFIDEIIDIAVAEFIDKEIERLLGEWAKYKFDDFEQEEFSKGGCEAIDRQITHLQDIKKQLE